MTLRDALTAATSRLAADPHLRETASRDAEILLLHTLGLPRTALYSDPTRDLTVSQFAVYESALNRRLTLEPIQYITGTQEFYGLALHVTPAVLIPRPETELLVESVLAILSILPADLPLRLVDVGTGSGAIAIAMAHHLPQAHITALDLSAAALAIATQNAETHHVTDRITFLQSDLLAAVAGRTFDAILSNPPYVPGSDLDTLHPQVRDYEPHGALFAGPTGLDVYGRLIPEAERALTPGGLLALEIGHGQQQAVSHLLHHWTDLSVIKDLQHIPRTVLARKPAKTD